MQVQPYLFFEGRCEEALEFYRTAAGAQVEALMRYQDTPGGCPEAMSASADKVMHASFRLGDTQVMASDGNCGGEPSFAGFGLALSVATEAEADRIFGGLSDGGQIVQPLMQTFFSPKFGMVKDRFGVHWMVMVAPPAA